MKKLLFATTAALLAMTVASNAAIIGDLGLDPNLNVGRTVGNGVTGGPFDDQFLFHLDNMETITIVAILNTFPLGPNTPAFIAGFTGSVIAGIPALPGATVIGPTMATMGCGPVVNCQSLGGTATLGPGNYFLDFSGDAGITAAYGGTINTVASVPGPIVGAGLPGLLSALGGLWFLNRNRRKRNDSFDAAMA